MTYKELYESAADKLEKSKITLGEFEKMIEPLNAEVATDSDTISRANAIEICDHAIDLLKGQFGAGALVAIKESIEELPPVQPAPSQVAKDISRIVENGQDMRVIGQPERIKGHWVNGRCDKCNEHAPFWAMASTYHESNFCPNCGADMREEKEK